MRERMEKVRSKRVSTSEESPLPSETQVHGTEASVQPAETSTGEVATAISEGSMENDSSDEQSEDEEYAFTYEEAQSILREWSSDQVAEAMHVQGILLVEVLMREADMSRSRAAEVAAKYVPSSERSLRRWHSDFYVSSGDIVPEERGTWKRNILLNDEKVLSKATKWLRAETAKRNSDLTVAKFKNWINSHLLPSIQNSQPSQSKIVSVTAWKLMKKAGFQYSQISKGFVDGHERSDVKADRVKFIDVLCTLEATHKPPPTCSDGIHPYALGNSSADKHVVLIFHDETVFHSNEGRVYAWHEKGSGPLRPKDQGRGIMVTDFIDEFNGYLRLSQSEIARRDELGQDVPIYAREVMHIGEEHEGYFTADNFCLQVAKAAQIAAFKYPPETYDVIFVFDQAKIHMTYDDDALVAHRMNVKPGGKAPVMRPSSLYTINGAPQTMTLSDGRPKGLRMVLEERGVNTHKLVKEQMIEILASHDDFRNEKNKVERLLVRFNYRAMFIPKFHPELNPIERVWGRAKVYARNHCNYSFVGLQNTVTPALESVSLDAIRKYFRKSRDYIHAYREGISGYQANEAVKKYKSHRKVPEQESFP